MDREAQFQELRPLLFALAYRMLGTRADAEDVVQEAWLRWQVADGDVRSPKYSSPRWSRGWPWTR